MTLLPWTSSKKRREKEQLDEWNKNGCPVPPPHIVKQKTIQEYQEKYSHSILVETGTYKGAMIEAQKKRFRKIYSIELGKELFDKATERFKNNRNVTIVHGDSGKILSQILQGINEPAIFWLDGHYSDGITARGEKDCPIFEEIDAIFNTAEYNHVLLVDDARRFTGVGDYPTIDQLTEYVLGKNKKYKVEVKHDIIRYFLTS